MEDLDYTKLYQAYQLHVVVSRTKSAGSQYHCPVPFRFLGFNYPSVTADSGYESEEGYSYLREEGQQPYIKPQTYEKWKKGVLKGTAGDLPEKSSAAKVGMSLR